MHRAAAVGRARVERAVREAERDGDGVGAVVLRQPASAGRGAAVASTWRFCARKARKAPPTAAASVSSAVGATAALLPAPALVGGWRFAGGAEASDAAAGSGRLLAAGAGAGSGGGGAIAAAGPAPARARARALALAPARARAAARVRPRVPPTG